MIRKATEADLQALAALFRQLHEYHIRIAPESHRTPFPQYYELEMRSFLEDRELEILISEEKGAICAYAVYRIFEREKAERTPARICYIEHFTVAEEHRRSGIGTELFEAVKCFALERGCDRIQLGAAANNTDALSFYERQGMIPRTIKLELTL